MHTFRIYQSLDVVRLYLMIHLNETELNSLHLFQNDYGVFIRTDEPSTLECLKCLFRLEPVEPLELA